MFDLIVSLLKLSFLLNEFNIFFNQAVKKKMIYSVNKVCKKQKFRVKIQMDNS